MNDVITEYQKWKQQGEDLRVKAKAAMESRYRELLIEAVKVAEEYRHDFGGTLKPPPLVSAFRYKAGSAKKRRPGPKSAPAATAEITSKPEKKAQPQAKPDPKVLGLQKRLAAAKKRLDAAKTAGKPTRDIDDRIYEIEDALQMAQRNA
jgi:hypothetical protein